jgi:hypothetical protein
MAIIDLTKGKYSGIVSPDYESQVYGYLDNMPSGLMMLPIISKLPNSIVVPNISGGGHEAIATRGLVADLSISFQSGKTAVIIRFATEFADLPRLPHCRDDGDLNFWRPPNRILSLRLAFDGQRGISRLPASARG